MLTKISRVEQNMNTEPMVTDETQMMAFVFSLNARFQEDLDCHDVIKRQINSTGNA